MANRNTGKRSSNGAKTPAASPASSNGTIPNEKAPECAAATDTSSAEFRQLVVQTQVRSLRRRLWHAFQREDADTALRAYKATAKDLQDWVREEIQEARDREARRLQQEKDKKELQRPTMMKRLSLAAVVPSSNKKQPPADAEGQRGKSNRSSFRRRSRANTTGGTPKESSSSFFPKLKKPPPSPPKPEPTTNTETDLIMANISTDGTALLPVHMNPSEPFQLDDYKNPMFEIDPNTGEPKSIAAMMETEHTPPSIDPSQSQQSNRHFKSFRKRKSLVSQPRTATSSFWASLHIRSGRGAAAAAGAATLADATDLNDPSESTAHPDSPTGHDAQTVALMDPKMTTPLHEAARLGDAELVRLMLSQPFAEPNFKNGQKRTALHMVAGGWTEAEERLWRARQQKMETKLNHKKKQQGGSLKTGSAHAEIGVSAPLPIELETPDAAENNDKDSHMGAGAKKAARAMGRFFNTTFSTANSRDRDGGANSNRKKAPPSESQGYLVWDEQLWNKLRTERMDCLLAVMSWCHPDDGTSSAGEGASVNAVDAQGRTALHYAAELGREDVCMAVLSSFGAMLTVVDEMARTPCELAAEQNHPELAAQLEARALLYSDPYGMDDELLAAVMEEQRVPDENELMVGEHESAAIAKARMSLAAPFSWFRTLTMHDVDKERKKRLADCCIGMMSFVKNKEEENELKKVMYGMKDDDDNGNDDDTDEKADSKTENIDSAADKADSKDQKETEHKGQKETENKIEGEAASSAASNEASDDCVSSRNTGEGDAGWELGEKDEERDSLIHDNAANSHIAGDTQEIAAQAGSSLEQKEAGQPKNDPPGEDRTSTILDSKPSAEPESNLKSEEDQRNLSDDDLSSLKSIQTAHIAHYLFRQGWVVEDALMKYTENPLKALKEAGVPLQATHHAQKRAGAKEEEDENEDSIRSSMCLICFDEFDIADGDSWTHLVNCSHSFCNRCLGDYLVDCAKSRSTGLSVPCPHHECVVPMAQPEIRTLAPSNDVYEMLQHTANDNFIASARDLRFCSHPGCSGVVKVSISATMKRFGVDFDFLSCADAVCTAVHSDLDESKIDVGDGETPPVTYEGVVDLQLTNVRSKSPPICAHRFCFGCGESKRHFPVACEALEEWKKKILEEVEQVAEDGDGPETGENYEDVAQRLWMRANTRPCPKCKAPIEKNEGCNHMSCFNPQCKHEFCWICRKDWKLHSTATGGFFRCNRWQDEDKHDFYDTPPPADQMPPALSAEEAANDEIMSNPEVMAQTYGTAMHEHRVAWKKSKEMKRFLHHYTRWNAHMESAALEKMMSENVCERLAPVVDAAAEFMCDANYNFGGKGLSFVHAAFKELLECRSVLQHSYAYGFFKFESLALKRQRHGKRAWNEKIAFEQLQSELEIITEQMSDIVARSHLRATQTQILFLTVGASERRNEFSNLIFTLLKEEKKQERNATSEARPRSSRNIVSAPIAGGAENIGAAAAGTFVVQGLANEDVGDDAQVEQQGTETVREALMASLEAFMANTEDPPTFVAHVDVNDDDNDDNDDENGNNGANEDFDGEEEEDDDDEEDDEQFNSWACSACTYMNTTGRFCAMCGTPPTGA